MDKMAYLQQISTNNNAGKSTKDSAADKILEILKKVLTLKNIIIAAVVVIILVVGSMVYSELTKVDTRDQDLLVKSYYLSNEMMSTINKNSSKLKNAELRSMSATLNSLLSEVYNTDSSLLLSNYGIKVASQKKTTLAQEETTRMAAVNTDIDNSMVSRGKIDSVYLNDMTLQIAYLISYQSECAERTKNSNVKTSVEDFKENLKNIYDRFYNFDRSTL